jgi:hypothetical protein
MRKIFGGAMLFSALGAAILGGALAWQSSEYTPVDTATVGTIAFTVQYDGSFGVSTIGPNDGVPRDVGAGALSNTGTFDLTVKSLNVYVTEVTGEPNCRSDHFVGSAVVAPGSDLEDGLFAGQALVEGFIVRMAVVPAAPESCMGAVVSFRTLIEMQTVS